MGIIVPYRKLSPARGRGGGAVRAWVMLLRQAAARVAARLQRAARRRCGGGGGTRLTWAGLCVRAVSAAPRRISSAARSYDPASYARNFDDGVWKAEEGVSSWSGGTGRPLSGEPADANGNSSSNSR